jgi:hypothetical protein
VAGSEAAEKTLRFVAQRLGDDHHRFSDRFPQQFYLREVCRGSERFAERKDLPAKLSRKILWDNPKKLYGI